MREYVIQALVKTLTEHDQEEKRIINLSRTLKCRPSDLPQEEKVKHDELEWLTLDLFEFATPEEGRVAIDRYDSLKPELL